MTKILILKIIKNKINFLFVSPRKIFSVKCVVRKISNCKEWYVGANTSGCYNLNKKS